MEWQGYPKGNFNNFMNWVKGTTEIINEKVTAIHLNNENVKYIETENSKYEADLYLSTIPLKDCFEGIKEENHYVGCAMVAAKFKKGPLPTGVGNIFSK